MEVSQQAGTRDGLRAVSLDDKYSLTEGVAFISGTQALVRLLINQKIRDEANGLKTGGLVTGYRGSPLGNVDHALWSAEKGVTKHGIKFLPAVNEDLAATMCWGAQQLALLAGEATVDGVFSMWYGKGPGVDRSGDALKHGNAAGTSAKGGVLVLAGDDHTAKSSTFGHQSEQALISAFIPVLYPSNVQECIDFGVYGWAMSRFSGLWVSMKCVSDVVETTAVADVSPFRVQPVFPASGIESAGGLHIRSADVWAELEPRIVRAKLPTVLAFCAANKINQIIFKGASPKLGIVSAGKAYTDVRQALALLGLSDKDAESAGISLLKLGMVWPLEPTILREFSAGQAEVLVVEEKRPLIEQQIKDELYADAANGKDVPRVSGKSNGMGGGEWGRCAGQELLRSDYELTPIEVARAIVTRLKAISDDIDAMERLERRLSLIESAETSVSTSVARKPYFCSGCPHNTSTKLPEGSRATAGIGCHYMAQWMDRSTASYTHMGAEGTPWVVQSLFSTREHIFSNMGDGTYFHSGSLAIRQAVAGNATMTFKILYNDAAAMTGGQPVDGDISVQKITRQVAAEGVRRIAVVSDDIEKYTTAVEVFAEGTTIHHRSALDEVQRALRETKGVSVLVYDQTCAAEKRRRRKKKTFPDPARRVLINEAVCEGCGDCSVKSNCLSIEPLETEFGRKRAVNQSTCNKDFSCVDGFCPSFITIEGGALRKAEPKASASRSHGNMGAAEPWLTIKEPILPPLNRNCSLLVAGVGGTGVVTIGAILGMAAHLSNMGCSILDMAGLAQKGGAVWCHVQLAPNQNAICASRIADGQADAVIGCDLIVSSQAESLLKMKPGTTKVVVNANVSPSSEFVLNRDWKLPEERLFSAIKGNCGESSVFKIDAQDIAVEFIGDSIYANIMLLGYAWQKGWIPLSLASLNEAIRLNGQSVDKNMAAFGWGRYSAEEPAKLKALMSKPQPLTFVRKNVKSLDEIVRRRAEFLRQYQDETYAQSYISFIEKVKIHANGAEKNAFVVRVANSLFKLMSYKDEYEVARLHSSPDFLNSIASRFEGKYKVVYHLAPPMLSKRNANGQLQKSAYGGWMLPAFKVLAKLRFLRGTPLDIFGYTAERKMERKLIEEYRASIEQLLPHLATKLDACIELAGIPEMIRGFGHVKEVAEKAARERQENLLRKIIDIPTTLPGQEPTSNRMLKKA